MNQYPAPNSVLVMDNAKIHRGGRIAQLCRDAGVKLIYLPPYCPELNPIKLCFSQVKSNLQRTQSLVKNSNPTWAIMLTFHDVVSTTLLRGLYQHAGYSCPSAHYIQAQTSE
jgi:transposase